MSLNPLQMQAMKLMFQNAAFVGVDGPVYLAEVMGAGGAAQIDELANEIAQWAIAFCGALADKAHG